MPLTALHIADGFLRAGTVQYALVVASDADPGRGLAPRFPFAASGAAAVCRWDGESGGLVGFRWEMSPEDGDLLQARVGFERGRNVLRIEEDPTFGERAAAWVGKAAACLLADHGVGPGDIDLVVPSPLTARFLDALLPTWAWPATASSPCRGRPCAHGRAAGRARGRPGAGPLR